LQTNTEICSWRDSTIENEREYTNIASSKICHWIVTKTVQGDWTPEMIACAVESKTWGVHLFAHADLKQIQHG